ncbi:MAG: carboxypeptidase regulatory-like domain-containing protein [Acidobacteriaceae bacterium]|nr:carboxypeptidase regulatory-like domain-containing protein [Acidobacteriaceae bacterium]
MSRAAAQGVTTSGVSGIVRDAQGAVVPGATITAVHEPSGTIYDSVSQADGHFAIQGMRIGGPYKVSAELTGFRTEEFSIESLQLGVTQNVEFTLQLASVAETITVVGTADPVFSTSRTGAATSIDREEIAQLPTLNGRINDITRLTPQASGGGGFAGNDNRMNNITVDGSSFNNSFGLGGQPGDRTGVAPISLEAIEQVQVNIAPFDVRQGSFTGAGVNTVTRSGTNTISGSLYDRTRSQSWVGTNADGQTVNPGTFTFRDTGGWLSGPIIKNKWFAFGNYEDQLDNRPLTTFRANTGGEPVAGAVSRVLASDLTALSSYLKSNFNYDTGGFDNLPKNTPAKRFLVRSDYNLNNRNKISFRYNLLNSSSDQLTSGSNSALGGRSSVGSTYLVFNNSTYSLLENIRSGIGEWNSVLGNSLTNTLQIGYTTQDESRGNKSTMFPFVDIFSGGTSYTSFGFEPFSVNNELRYQTFQMQDNLTKAFGTHHSVTVGAYAEKYHSDNVFFSCCPQGAWAYSSLADFYTDANDFLANPNRTVSPVAAQGFQLRWSNIPGLDKPLQQLDVWYSSWYAQDEWRARPNVTVTGGIRFDVSSFKNTAFQNPAADALTFRDLSGQPIQFKTGEMPGTKVLSSPRVGINWDVLSDQSTQVRGGTGLFSGRPAYVWISNQIGNTGVLIGELKITSPTTDYPFTTDPSRYAGTPTGAGASSYQLNVTDPNFKFPQVWRSNIAVDRKLPWGIVSTTELLESRDINGTYYYDANLPAAQSAFTGVDNRPRWVGTSCNTPTVGPCATRLNNTAGNVVTGNYVLTNGNQGRAWNIAQSFIKQTGFGLSLRGAYSYGKSESITDAGSTASASFASTAQSGDPNHPGLGISAYSPGHRVFANIAYTHKYFGFGATSISTYWEMHQASRISYVFAGDMNGDGISGNDLIYIPKNQSEMNFVPLTVGTRTFTPQEQADAFEAYIKQDAYLSQHRGQYAARNGAVTPMYSNVDLSVIQDLFHNIAKAKNGVQLRLDIVNFGNMLNNHWGVGMRTNAPGGQILTYAGVDTNGAPTYRMAVANNQLITNTFSSSASGTDVWQMMLSLRYSFN